MLDRFRFSRCSRPALALASLALLLAGCDWASGVGFDAQSAMGSVSLGERCVDFMRRAFPDTRLDATDRKVSAESDSTTVVITADRRNVPADGLYARKVGVECRFENGVLTSFRWTEGPIRPLNTGQAP